DLGKVTWCCTPRMSEKRRSTNSTRWSAMSFSMFSMGMAERPAGKLPWVLQVACQGRWMASDWFYWAAADGLGYFAPRAHIAPPQRTIMVQDRSGPGFRGSDG